MPRRRFRTKPSRRRYKRRARRIPPAIGNSKIVKFKTVDYALKTSTSGALAYWAYPIMDLLDPTGGHGTQQPLFFDQMTGLYHKAVVLGYKITVRFHNAGTVASMVGISPMPENQGNTGLTDYEHYMEHKGTKSKLLSPDVDHTVMWYSLNTRKFIGLKSLKDESAFHTTISGSTASPTRTPYMFVWSQPCDRTTTNSVEYVGTIEMVVRLFDPIVPTRS